VEGCGRGKLSEKQKTTVRRGDSKEKHRKKKTTPQRLSPKQGLQ